MKVFVLCFLFVGVNAGYLDIKEELASDASAVFSPLVGAKWGNFLGYVGVEVVQDVAEVAAVSLLGKREVPHKVTIKEVLTNGADATKLVLDNYATELQHFNEQIASLDYLKGDVNQFLTDMQHSKLIHDKELDQIVFGVKRTLSCDKEKTVNIVTTSRACEQFTSAVDKLKEKFTEVHGRLEEGSKGILGAVNDHVLLLNNALIH